VSRQDDETRRAIVRTIVAAFIEHPEWPNKWIARDTGFDEETITEVRAFALSFPPIDGVREEPKDAPRLRKK
jgi:hypothetical protein